MHDPKDIPRHVAIIMDGNGRWASRRGLPKIAGHRAGVNTAREIVKAAGELGIKVLTLYTFSTENWKRPKREVNALFGILENYLDKEEKTLNENKVRFSVMGRIETLPRAVQEKLKRVIDSTRQNTGLRLNLALNYGSRTEIIDAVRRIAADAADGKISPQDVDENTFSGYLYTKDMPDPDLLIRTSGETRVSNFLLWQISYSELYFTKKLWPDFKKRDLGKALAEYRKRERRFGA